MENVINNMATPLPYIDDVVPFNEKDHELMKEMKVLLAKHNALNRFGITLLHDHFPISEEEEMVEFQDSQNQTLTAKPMSKAKLAEMPITLMETQWRLDVPNVLAMATMKCVKHQGNRHEVVV